MSRSDKSRVNASPILRHPAVPYVLPFLVFILFLALRNVLPSGWEYPMRVLVTGAALATVSRGVLSFKPRRPASSVALGVAVFVIWVAPDMLWPGYRQHWLLSNGVTGRPHSSLPDAVRTDTLWLAFRIIGTALVVPVIEELFWRGWLMRYLVRPEFQSVRLGTFTALSFWATAALFASEHGPYWDVGLLAGIAYGWWIIRTQTLSDCILAHAVTNACLAAYVVSSGHWEYWL